MELFALKELSTSDAADLQEVDLYQLEQIIQKGKGCTRLLKASSPDSEQPLVIKLFPKKNPDTCAAGFQTEQRCLTQLSHPYLLKYHAFYNDALIKGKKEDFCRYSAIVMEYVSSGDLFSFVDRDSLSEQMARTLFRQMLSVLEYLHSEKLAHLDIKLENFLIAENGIRLIDFEACQNLQNKCSSSSSSSTTDFCQGTPGYRAPETVKGGYQDLTAADIYSLGVVLFTMVTGTPPYTEVYSDGSYKFDQYYEALRKDKAKFWRVHDHYRADDGKEPLSKEFKELIEKMLAEKPEDRPSLNEIKRTKWNEGKIYPQEELIGHLAGYYEEYF